jgi:glycosyltransferase involved in cell wall biosynthesis
MKTRVTCVVNTDFDCHPSGMSTFVHELSALREDPDIDFHILEMPLSAQENNSVEQGALDAEPLSTPVFGMSIRLLCGYLRTIKRQTAVFRQYADQLSGRIILLNHFGCETIPIAARKAFADAIIISVVHTHPGQTAQSHHWVRRFIEEKCCRSIDQCVFVSQSVKSLWETRLNGIGCGEPGVIIHHGIQSRKGLPVGDYPAKPRPDCVDFLYVARFVDWKGHLALLRAWNSFCKTHSDMLDGRTRLLFVGSGPTEAECKAWVAEHMPDGSVIFLGAKENASRYMFLADVMILYSLEPEAFGLVTIEAFSQGKPIVATSVGANAELIKHNENGLLVEPGDALAMMSVLYRLATQSDLRERIGAAASRCYYERYTPQKMLYQYKSYFLELSNSHR